MDDDDLVSPLRAVFLLDPAIDLESTPIKVYADTRAPALVTVKHGHHPRWATLRRLDTNEVIANDAMPSLPLRLSMAFRIACVGVENFAEPGVGLFPTKTHRAANGREITMWGDEEFQRLASALGIEFVYEMGQVALDRSRSGNGWSGSVLFTEPLSCRLARIESARQRAERELTTDGTRSSET